MSVEPVISAVIEPEATLEDCEQALRQAERNAAIAQGAILRHVRDHRLYRQHHATFEEYVEKRLGYERTWAYRRIELAETTQVLAIANTPAIENVGQARAIKPVLRDHGPEVAVEVLRQAADDNDGKVTARAITEAAQRVIEPEVITAEEFIEDYGLVEDDWTSDERALAEALDAGGTVVVNMRDEVHARLWRYALDMGKAERIDRKSMWGNPFIIGDDGDRDAVCDAYENIYFPHKPRLIAEAHDLQGKALGCWCAPLRCHGDHLARMAGS